MLQKIPRDAVQKLCLAKQIYPGRTLYVQESFKDACASSFFYDWPSSGDARSVKTEE